ncbi:MAG: radical SAM family heme chaperone HemW [Oscillospiraceae bacterium]|nr:radical SAM family heme chaperone HemW [Oscillospiraceae bacterium]
MKNLGIYIHIPFCAKKCPYCDFFSVSYSKELVLKYTDAVIRNLIYYGNSENIIDTVYFGGGTPSLIPADCIERILDALNVNFKVSENPEITIEVNPNTVNSQKLRDFYNMGINRLSVGVQSLVPSELITLGRTHTAEKAVNTVTDAVNVGFRNISCDMMIGVAGQNIDNIGYTIEKLSELPVTHISSYILKIEENTAFNTPDIINSLPDDDYISDMYLFMVSALEKKGFIQYEVSNFAKSGFQSIHNNKYWKCEDYLGIGTSSHSCFGNKRFAVKPDIKSFIKSPVQDIYVTDENPCGKKEYAMLRLRLKEGLEIYGKRFSYPEIIPKIQNLINAGYINFDEKKISLTPEGYLISNSIIEYLIF